MQVPGSTPGDSQRVEGVAVIDTEPARNLSTGNVSEGSKVRVHPIAGPGRLRAFHGLSPALTLRAWPRPLDCKATIRAPNDHALDASELVDMGDDPFSETSPWNASHKHSCRGHVFNLARIVAAAFQDVISGSRQRDSFASAAVLSFSCQSHAPSRRRA